MSAKTVVLVGCSGPKLSRTAPARDFYTSDLFRKCRAYAEALGAEWAILSAKHGLVMPDQLLEPYDQKLGTRKAERETERLELLRDMEARALEDVEATDVKIVLTPGEAAALMSRVGHSGLRGVIGRAMRELGSVHSQGLVKAASVTFWITTPDRVEEIATS